MGIIGRGYPYYFSTTISEPGRFLTIPQDGGAVESIRVAVTTEYQNDRVILDATIPTIIHTGLNTSYGYNIVFRLYRDNQPLAVSVLSQTGQIKQANVSAQISDSAHLAWTDVPGEPGTYTYRVTVERGLLGEENITYVGVFNRKMGATVYPPNNIYP